jgi:hypothetical protein
VSAERWIVGGGLAVAAAVAAWWANSCRGLGAAVVQLPAFPGCAPAGGTPSGGTSAALMALESGGTPSAGSPSPFGSNPSNPPGCAPGYVPQYIDGYGWTCLYVGYGGQSVVTQPGPTGAGTLISTTGLGGTTTQQQQQPVQPVQPVQQPPTQQPVQQPPLYQGVQQALTPANRPATITVAQQELAGLFGPGAKLPSRVKLQVPATLRGPSSVGLAETLANALARGIGGQVTPGPPAPVQPPPPPPPRPKLKPRFVARTGSTPVGRFTRLVT